MRELQKTWNEFWAEFFRIRHRRTIPGIDAWDRKVVDHIIAVLDLHPGERVLDLACGSGEQACELARRGMITTGIDIADVLVEHAQAAADREGLAAEFRICDMRSLPFENEFDACTLLSGSFGFFDDETNVNVLKQIAKALKPGGQLYIQARPPGDKAYKRRIWAPVDSGYLLMEDTYDPATRREGGSFFYITSDGDMITFAPEPDGTSVSESLKLYTLDEYKSMLPATGLTFTAAYGSIDLPPTPFDLTMSDLIVLAKKPS